MRQYSVIARNSVLIYIDYVSLYSNHEPSSSARPGFDCGRVDAHPIEQSGKRQHHEGGYRGIGMTLWCAWQPFKSERFSFALPEMDRETRICAVKAFGVHKGFKVFRKDIVYLYSFVGRFFFIMYYLIATAPHIRTLIYTTYQPCSDLIIEETPTPSWSCISPSYETCPQSLGNSVLYSSVSSPAPSAEPSCPQFLPIRRGESSFSMLSISPEYPY